MNPGAVKLMIGLWVTVQVIAGQALQRLKVLPSSQPAAPALPSPVSPYNGYGYGPDNPYNNGAPPPGQTGPPPPAGSVGPLGPGPVTHASYAPAAPNVGVAI